VNARICPEPAAQVAQARLIPAPPRKGRPQGSFTPLGHWLRSQIAKYKRQGASCRNTYRALSLVEGGDDDGFVISDETADSWLYDLGVSISGEPVSYDGFRKAWQRVKLF